MTEMSKFITATFAKPMTENDDPSIKEINRRLLENIEEGYELGIIQ